MWIRFLIEVMLCGLEMNLFESLLMCMRLLLFKLIFMNILKLMMFNMCFRSVMFGVRLLKWIIFCWKMGVGKFLCGFWFGWCKLVMIFESNSFFVLSFLVICGRLSLVKGLDCLLCWFGVIFGCCSSCGLGMFVNFKIDCVKL